MLTTTKPSSSRVAFDEKNKNRIFIDRGEGRRYDGGEPDCNEPTDRARGGRGGRPAMRGVSVGGGGGVDESFVVWCVPEA